MLLLDIYTEGDQARGLGHLSRCFAVSKEWKKIGGIVRWIVDGDFNARDFLKGEKVDWSCWQHSTIPTIYHDKYAIVDSYTVNSDVLEIISSSYKNVVYFDDTLRLVYPRGLVVHASPDSVRNIVDHAKWLLGPSWQPLRASFTNVAKRTYHSRQITNILVIMGATDIRKLSIKVASLAHEIYTNALVHIITPDQIKESFDNYKFYRNLNDNDLYELMMKCDIAISAAGQTTFELAVCGLPSILISVADNQVKQMEGWGDLGGFLIAGNWDCPSLERKIMERLQDLQAVELRKKISIKMQSLSNGSGAKKIVEYLIGNYSQ